MQIFAIDVLLLIKINVMNILRRFQLELIMSFNFKTKIRHFCSRVVNHRQSDFQWTYPIIYSKQVMVKLS